MLTRSVLINGKAVQRTAVLAMSTKKELTPEEVKSALAKVEKYRKFMQKPACK
jgi:hypothetical protein